MNKRISSSLSIALLVVLAAAFAFFSWNKHQELNKYMSFGRNNMIKKTESKPCKTRAFEGLVEIKVWQTGENEKMVLGVAKEDLEKLPLNTVRNLKLIDPTPELEKKLAESSEESPVAVSISGFASLCNGISLASLDYKDGIFRPFIVN